MKTLKKATGYSAYRRAVRRSFGLAITSGYVAEINGVIPILGSLWFLTKCLYHMFVQGESSSFYLTDLTDDHKGFWVDIHN